LQLAAERNGALHGSRALCDVESTTVLAARDIAGFCRFQSHVAWQYGEGSAAATARGSFRRATVRGWHPRRCTSDSPLPAPPCTARAPMVLHTADSAQQVASCATRA